MFEPPGAMRYRERTVAERMNARLKDEFGERNVWGLSEGQQPSDVRYPGPERGSIDAPALLSRRFFFPCAAQNPCA